MIKVAIIGASGYTGAESIRILLQHPQAKLTYLTALPDECGAVADVFPQFKGRCELQIEPLDLAKVPKMADCVLCCLPHKVSMGFVPKLLDAGLKVIDFSADYRIRDIAVYEKYYVPHTDPENLKKAAFGLPEIFRSQIKGANLVANPGCYPTGASLAVAPLLKKDLVKDTIIVNAVTGSSGAGVRPSSKFHFPNMNENLFAYGIGTHRHTPEIEQIMTDVAGKAINVLFQPHVGPFDRGILSTVYCQPKKKINNDDLQQIFSDFYKSEHFVRVCKAAPGVKDIVGGNYCHIYPCTVKDKFVIFSVIDNLTKGAAGQAIQNMNIIFGLDETLGLR